MLFKEPSRPFDITASSILNFIEAEVREITEANTGLFVPSHGPYYADTLVVRHGTEILIRNKDYHCYVLHTRASLATSKGVACCVKVVKPGVATVEIDYQVPGGQYQSVFDVLKDMLDENSEGVRSPLYWKDILDIPDLFNPTSHMHPYWELEGWAELMTPLDTIKQAVLAKKYEKVQSVYDYLHAKIAQFESNLDSKLTSLSKTVDSTKNKAVDPVGSLVIRTDIKDVNNLRDGSWVAVEDRVLMTGLGDNISKEAMLSEDIVYPQPDNILLDDNAIPIIRDDNEWIYLDNKHPVAPGEDEDYGKPYDTQFDLFHYKGWVKVAKGADTSQKLVASPTTIKEGESTTFTLTTTGYDKGMQFPYMLSGVGVDNIDQPLYGYLTIDDSGKASLKVELIEGSPRTDNNQLVMTVLSVATLTATVNYTLKSNESFVALTYATTGRNTVKLEKLVIGDQFFIVIRTQGLKDKSIHLKLSVAKGTHQFSAMGYSLDGDKGYKLTVDSEGKDLYIPIQSTQKDAIAPEQLLVTVDYNGTTLDTFKVACELLEFKAVWKSMDMLKEITTVNDKERFVLDVSHNSRQSLIYNISTIANPVSGYMLADIPHIVYVQPISYGRTAFMEINRDDKSTTDIIKIRIYSTLLATQYIEQSITVLPVEQPPEEES